MNVVRLGNFSFIFYWINKQWRSSQTVAKLFDQNKHWENFKILIFLENNLESSITGKIIKDNNCFEYLPKS